MPKKKDEPFNDGTKWVIYDQFSGLNTVDDPEKVKDSEWVEGGNVSFNNGDRLSLRNLGYEQFGSLSAFGTTDPITSLHTFRRRDGQAIMMASFGTYLVYFNPSSLTWEPLKVDCTSGKVFGYADYTLHTDTSSYVYFGNGVDMFARWSGNYAKLTQAISIGDTVVHLDSIAGWPMTGSTYINGVVHAYIQYGSITGATVSNVGAGYHANDVLTVVQAGGATGTIKVNSVDGSGKITAISVLTGGTGYHPEADLTTSVAPAGGTGAKITITHVNSGNTINLSTIAGSVLANGRGLSEYINIQSGATFPIGNIYLMANNRLFISGVSGSPQAVYFSKYGDPLDFSSTSLVTGSTATASGTFNLAEGGGAVTGMVFDEGSIYAFKQSMIYKITLSDSLYVLQQIKPFDGKSQTIGGIAQKCIFTGSNYVFFTTPDRQIMSLERVESVDYPQNVPISLNIMPSIKKAKFDVAAGITFNDIAYLSFKSSDKVDNNDVVYPWNISNKFWNAPITGWNASDFTVYNNGTTEDLYFGSSNNTNIYKVIEENRDDIYDVKGLIKSKQFTFGLPQSQKIMTDLFIEGYITEDTELGITLYLDDDGYTQTFSTVLSGKEKDFQFSKGLYNTFGVNPFAVEVLGSNDDFTWLTKFRIYLNKNFRLKPFYNCQIEFSSEGKNQNWEVIQYGFKVGQYSQEENRKLFKIFN